MNKKRILILGSGPLKIGQAGEFDYSGSQAIKAFKEEGHEVVLINPNIATYQTSHKLADRIYFLPVNEYFTEEVIKKEKVDSVAISFGGQTALNCALSLEKKGVFKKYNIEVLGTPIHAIRTGEDRKLFSDHLRKLNIKTPQSKAVSTVSDALRAAKKIGYPVMTRAAFALGGQKSGVANNEQELSAMLRETFTFAKQVLIEQYLLHFKEIEYEVVRDKYDNCVAVCNMENMDPLGVHTGDSIVIAPSQTLTNTEYQYLRNISIQIVRSMDVIGECNVQFALNPHPGTDTVDYYVIEMNPRLSRSSALASKATGYPLAYIAAKLILGKSLADIRNKVTKVTKSFFEPALDYLVIKIPRWDLQKFRGVEDSIGSAMKSVGEVMSIGRTFEGALQKAVRMLDLGLEGVSSYDFENDPGGMDRHLEAPTTHRLFAIATALARGVPVSTLHTKTGIDEWFLYRIKNIVDTEKQVKLQAGRTLEPEFFRKLKQIGLSDKRIAELTGSKELTVRSLRKSMGIVPSVFQIDTLAGEFPAQTNYLYLTYNGNHNDVEPTGRKGIIILGSGPYRIGSSVEFDWTCVNAALALKNYNRKSIIINNNPETVSTDYDMTDRLYFEELTFEAVADIYEFENPEGVIVSVGGQAPHNILQKLHTYDVPILGTQPEHVDTVEDRSKFSALCDKLGLSQPAWARVDSIKQACDFAEEVGFPVLIRPSYVLSGAAMSVSVNKEELIHYIKKATVINKDYPVTISKYIQNAKEIEFDGVAQEGEILISALSEHVENAGVHSGDATIIFPPQRIYLITEKKIYAAAEQLVKALEINGPFNIQFLGVSNEIKIIEMNARASRTFPYISRANSRNFARMIVDVIHRKGKKRITEYPQHVLVKTAQFSFSRLRGADPVLHVEMASTGEAACFGKDPYEAFYKAMLSVGERAPQKGVFVSLAGLENRMSFFSSVFRLAQLKIPVYTTAKTHKFLSDNGINTIKINKIYEHKVPNVLTLFEQGKVDLAINIVDINLKKDRDDHTIMRRAAIDFNVHIMTNLQKAQFFIKTISIKKIKDLEIKAWDEYL